MFYFKKGDGVIEKYQVSFQKQLIVYLLEEIKFKCSRIVHVEYDEIYQKNVALTHK